VNKHKLEIPKQV